MRIGMSVCALVIAGAAAGCEPAESGDEPKNHGAEVSSVAHNTDATAKDKGAAVSDVAQSNDGQGQRRP
jgi:hypothetical protein